MSTTNGHFAGLDELGAPDVQWLTPRTNTTGNDLRVAVDAAGDVGVDRTAQRQRRRADPAL
ncbi:MAG: hypothetical protein ACRDRR_22585 [Pseudonocardiaceae bacterium]